MMPPGKRGYRMDMMRDPAPSRAGAGNLLDRIENLYLRALRGVLLVTATLLLIGAVAWGGLSLVRLLRSPDSVQPEAVRVEAADIAGTPLATAARASRGEPVLRNERAFYDGFVKRYYSLYRSRYQPSLRSEDKRLTLGEFDDLTINTTGRLSAVRDGRLDFAADRADLETFLPVVTAASSTRDSIKQLTSYRTARKRPVATQVQRTRTETRSGWDPYSTACDGWYVAPEGCAVTRRVEVPYTTRVAMMRYPDGIASPGEILKGFQDRYFALLQQRREASVADAAARRQDIVDGQAAGRAGLFTAIGIVAAFLVLMFFFLLVAIERHQRRLAVVQAS